jgi:hypothetical protein
MKIIMQMGYGVLLTVQELLPQRLGYIQRKNMRG